MTESLKKKKLSHFKCFQKLFLRIPKNINLIRNVKKMKLSKISIMILLNFFFSFFFSLLTKEQKNETKFDSQQIRNILNKSS